MGFVPIYFTIDAEFIKRLNSQHIYFANPSKSGNKVRLFTPSLSKSNFISFFLLKGIIIFICMYCKTTFLHYQSIIYLIWEIYTKT